MMNIAITGGIGAGKSTIINQLKHLYDGAYFFSMDSFVDELYKEKNWLNWLEKEFNTTDRVEISKLAFNDAKIRNAINSKSAMKIGVMLGKALKTNAMTFVEFPLLFETGMQDEFHLTIHITADVDTRIERVVARGKKSRTEAMQVISAQMPEHEKRELADVTIDTTSSSPEDCAEEISNAIYNEIMGL